MDESQNPLEPSQNASPSPLSSTDVDEALGKVIARVRTKNRRLTFLGAGSTATAIVAIIAAMVGFTSNHGLSQTSAGLAALSNTPTNSTARSGAAPVGPNSSESTPNGAGLAVAAFSRTTASGIVITAEPNPNYPYISNCVPLGAPTPGPIVSGGSASGSSGTASASTSSGIASSIGSTTVTQSPSTVMTYPAQTMPPVSVPAASSTTSTTATAPSVDTPPVSPCEMPAFLLPATSWRITVTATDKSSATFYTPAMDSNSQPSQSPATIATFLTADSHEIVLVALQTNDPTDVITLVDASGNTLDTETQPLGSTAQFQGSTTWEVVAAELPATTASGCTLPGGFTLSVTSKSAPSPLSIALPSETPGATQACSSMQVNTSFALPPANNPTPIQPPGGPLPPVAGTGSASPTQTSP